jgi:tetratricopeptide (TPR) repeat protein
MGEALAGSGQTSAACECYQKLDELSEEVRESDEGIEELYWLVVLPGLANCYRELDNLDPAADIYKRVLEHFYSEVEDGVSDEPDDGQYDYYDDFDEVEGDFLMAATATTNLMLVWYKQQKLAAIRALLESSDRKDTGYSGTRLIGVVQLNAANGNFHEQLRALVHDADAFSFVDQMYVSAIEATRSKDLSLTLALQHYRAMLNWLYGALAGSQDRAFEIWTNIIETTIPDDADETCFQMRIKASRELPKALLQRAKALGSGSPEANSYIERLEAVANRISSVIYDPNEDPVLTLGRYYHLAGDETRAKSVLRNRMKSVFQDWDEGADGFTEHLSLAHTFTALDDDLNALAAWSQLSPYPRDTKIEPAVASGDDGLATNGRDKSGASKSADEDDQASSGAEVSDESETDDSKSDRSDASASNNDPQTTEDTPEKLNSESPVNADEQSSELQGSLTWICDGCGSATNVDNIYCCKDCLDIQFDSNCYSKLKAGLLDKSICDPSHEFLHIPPFNKDKWVHLTTKDAVEIEGGEISRKEWLTGIRADWGVDRDTLEQEAQVVSSVVRIERVWKAFMARKSKRVQQRNGGANSA